MALAVGVASSQEYNGRSWPKRRAIVADTCPDVKLPSFTFGNQNGDIFQMRCVWKNTGQKEIEAVEFVFVRFDPFNRPESTLSVIGSKNAAQFIGVPPDGEGLVVLELNSSQNTYTSVAYPWSVRYADGTIWSANPEEVAKIIKPLLPDDLKAKFATGLIEPNKQNK